MAHKHVYIMDGVSYCPEGQAVMIDVEKVLESVKKRHTILHCGTAVTTVFLMMQKCHPNLKVRHYLVKGV